MTSGILVSTLLLICLGLAAFCWLQWQVGTEIAGENRQLEEDADTLKGDCLRVRAERDNLEGEIEGLLQKSSEALQAKDAARQENAILHAAIAEAAERLAMTRQDYDRRAKEHKEHMEALQGESRDLVTDVQRLRAELQIAEAKIEKFDSVAERLGLDVLRVAEARARQPVVPKR